MAVGAANWLLGKVLSKLSDDLVAGYFASRELGLNYNKITDELNHTLGLLHTAQGRDLSNNLGLQRLLEGLCKKADEAEDALDELHYFMIQDELDGTRQATPELGDGLGAQALHAGHAARNAAGKWLSCFSCCRSQDAAAAPISSDTHDTSDAMFDDNLPLDRVAMSNKIKQLLEDMHSKCSLISDLLKNQAISTVSVPGPGSMANPLERPAIGSIIRQDKLYGRSAIFNETIKGMTTGTCHETLSVLPIVGPGGIGKTTFTQHLYNDKRTEEHFTVRAWVCVSTNFDVLKLTKEILGCLPATDNEGGNETNNLDQLQISIAKRLISKRFLIVLDDIWECSEDKWANLLAPFKMREAGIGSMIIVTTRFPYIAQVVKTTTPVNLEGLEPTDFWIFFQACVFGEVRVEHDKELLEVARLIADKLKCSPLAAKTVGRLLKKRFSREHWVQILENKEWLNQAYDDDIMPALKISYDYLPFHLKKCFSYCALYPEDYKFESLEIGRFWISVGLTDSGGQNGKAEDIGSKYMNELFDYGFLMKGDSNYYVLHDLMHELAQMVSSKECAHISCSSFRAENIPSSIRHLSILMQNRHIGNFGGEMDKLRRKVDIGNLRSLMIFGEYTRASLVNILKDTFKEMKGLRVLFIFMNSLDSLPYNFSNLIHLRYLKLKSPSYSEVCLPTTVSRFYHLKFLDLKDWGNSYDLPKGISRLVNLCHFLSSVEFHSSVPEVGKLKLLQELTRFHVKKESAGFELRELGLLEKIGGKLEIYGLEHVRTVEEANEAKLMEKRNLTDLALVWSCRQPSVEDDILDGLKLHSNLRALSIVNHGGVTGPTWLCSNTHLKHLETLHLEAVSWSALPPFGMIHHLQTLKLKNIVGIRQFGEDFIGGITEKSFTQLKEVEFVGMPELVEWVGGVNAQLFSRLEKIRCINCPKLIALPFSGFPDLFHLYTKECPKLCLPPLPHTSKLSSFRTDYFYYVNSELSINEMPCELALHNLGEVETLAIKDGSLISFTDLQELHPLRSMEVQRCDETFLRALDDGIVLQSVQSLELEDFRVTSKSLANLFKCFPSLSELYLSASKDEDDDEEEVLLQFPPSLSSSLRIVRLVDFKNLVLPVEDGGGFQGLLSLESVYISQCGKLFSRWSMRAADCSSINPFPLCVKDLEFFYEPSTVSMALLSNLTSLTRLALQTCKNITMDGFNPLITCNLKDLSVWNWKIDGETEPYSVSIAGDLLAEVSRNKPMPAGACFSHLVVLQVDCISAVLVAPICTRLSTTLLRLRFVGDWRAESFTEEQDQALQLLSSLQTLNFHDCRALQSLPQGLHRLSSLESLWIYESHRIRSLPKEGFPDSLENLQIHNCCPELYEECQQLRGTRPDINVRAQPSRTTNQD